MCYHTTCLFSLCGHTAISARPVGHASPCLNLLRSREIEAAFASIQLRSSVDLVPPFPSPQEFEFAKELHNSIPASPISPVCYKQGERSATAACVSEKTSGSTHSSSICTKRTTMSKATVTPICSLITRHPLHTFVIPGLCRSCHRVREQNMAIFEAEAMRENVSRALEGAGGGGGTSERGGVVDIGRRRIHRHGLEKGKMIPLKLLQLHPAPVQDDPSGEVMWEEQENARAGMTNSSDLVGGVSINCLMPAPAMPEAVAMPVKEHAAEALLPVHSRDVSVASAKTASSWWSWGKPSTPIASITSSKPAATVTPWSPTGTTMRKTSLEASSRNGSSRLSWRTFSNIDVKRDILGRNMKGMNRIMGWETGDTAAS